MVGMIPVASAPACSWYEIAPRFDSVVSESAIEVGSASWLVEIEAYNGTSATDNFPAAPVASFPMAAVPFGTNVDPGTITLSYSTDGWIGEPSDGTKPNKLYQGRVSDPWRFERSLPLTPERGSKASVQFGKIGIINNDGALDTAAALWSIEGRKVRVLRGKRSNPRAAYSSFQLMADVIGDAWENDGKTISISVRGKEFNTDRPLAPVYAGTGGAEGTSNWKNKPRPLLFGKKRNIKPDLIDPSYLVYRLHTRQVQAIDAVRDQGVAVTAGSNYATYAALIAATVAAGTYATCLADGLIRLGASPVGPVTVDARGDASGSYVSTHGDIAVRIATDFGGIVSSEIDTASFSALPSGTAGVHFGSDRVWTTADAIDAVMKSCFAVSCYSRSGILTAYRLFDPSARNPTFDLTPRKMRGQPRALALPAPPRGRQRVGWRALAATQTASELAWSVTDADKLFYSKEYQVVTSINSETEFRTQRSDDLAPIVSMFDDEVDAQILGDYILAMHAPVRTYYEIPVGPLGYAVDIGSVPRVTFPRHDLVSGKNMVVVGMKEDGENVSLVVWG